MNQYLDFSFGLLGNIVSFMVFLAPVPTFYQIYKRKSTEGFQSVPYVVGLFSAMLWIYYAFLKTDTMLLITINSVGCFIQTVYITLYLVYAPKSARMQTMVHVVVLNMVGMGLIVLLTHLLLVESSSRATVVGWICLVFSICVFIAPLCVVRQVIRTKSVEYMPFLLSLFLTLSAVMWFFYGLIRKDYNIAIPNVLGFTFGVLQMVLYLVYRKAKKVVQLEGKLNEIVSAVHMEDTNKCSDDLKEQIIDVVKLSAVAVVCPDIIPNIPRIVDEHAAAAIINLDQDVKISTDPKSPHPDTIFHEMETIN
ncbi:bidirectional sugar transporter SWEET14-like [Andrographis paniculata]|uniref:bidirectional sugar transporter SWEET14-like n=1 Tax=Andrographis paniculata TaxID=175694 RepID=UPI0021E73C78|nr:bidirectional sugar transporter SWEET14-like [Andrographis paniculata]